MANVVAKIHAQLLDEASAPARRIAGALQGIEGATRGASRAGTDLRASNELAAGSARDAAAAASSQAAETRELAGAQRSAATTAARLAAAEGAAGAKSQQAARGFLQVDAAAKAKGRSMAESVNLVSELALGFSGLSPATQGLGLAFAGAGNNAFALAGALGPVGVIAGTLIALVPGLIGFFQKLGDGADDAARRMGNAERATRSFIDAVRERQRAEQGLEEESQIRTGEAESATIGAAIRERRAQASGFARGADALIRESGFSDEGQAALRAALASGDLSDEGLRRAVVETTTARVQRRSIMGVTDTDEQLAARRAAESRRLFWALRSARGTITNLSELRQQQAARASEADQLEREALPVAQRREQEEARREQLARTRELADATRTEVDATIAELPGLSSRQRALLTQQAATGAFSGAGAAALARVPESERSRLIGLVGRASALDERARADERTLRTRDLEEGLARLDAEFVSPAPASVRGGPGGPGGLRTEYVAAERATPAALEARAGDRGGLTDEDRAVIRDFTRTLAPIAREGLRVGVDVRSEGGQVGPAAPSFAGLGTTGR